MDDQDQDQDQDQDHARSQPTTAYPCHRRSLVNFFQGIAFTLLISAIFIGIYLTIVYRARIPPFINYAIVFDAGSSHTEMFVYHWPADKSDGLGTTSSVNELFVCPLESVFYDDSTKKGDKVKLKAISDFEHHLNLLDEYFRPCLKKALAKIPADRYKYSPIFLGATAGMRLARLRNATRARQVMETIRELFTNYPFQFVTARQVSQHLVTNGMFIVMKKRNKKKKQKKINLSCSRSKINVVHLRGHTHVCLMIKWQRFHLNRCID
jgi:hypothetical protein